MSLILKRNKTFDCTGYTVIIPSICVGNVAQLACDLLIASKKLKRIGSLNHRALIPVFGPTAYQHEPKETIAACEIYESSKDKLIVFQFRTPLISRHAASFHEELARIVSAAKRVIILSGSFSFEKRNIGGSPYEYCASDTFKKAHKCELEAVKWSEYQRTNVFGGGNAMLLFNKLKENDVPVMLLFRYLLDGENSTDASLILQELNELCEDFLQLKGQSGKFELIIPVSWKLLFGNEVVEQIF